MHRQCGELLTLTPIDRRIWTFTPVHFRLIHLTFVPIRHRPRVFFQYHLKEQGFQTGVSWLGYTVSGGSKVCILVPQFHNLMMRVSIRTLIIRSYLQSPGAVGELAKLMVKMTRCKLVLRFEVNQRNLNCLGAVFPVRCALFQSYEFKIIRLLLKKPMGKKSSDLICKSRVRAPAAENCCVRSLDVFH